MLGSIHSAAEVAEAVPELGSQLRLIEVADPQWVIVRIAPFEFPDGIGERGVTRSGIAEPSLYRSNTRLSG